MCPPIKENVLTSHKIDMLRQMYTRLYPNGHVQQVNRIVRSAKRAICGNLVFSTSFVSSSSAAMALWGSDPQLKLYYGDVLSMFHNTIQVVIEGTQVVKFSLRF